MKTKPRTAPIDLIVWHDPEGANTARELYNYLQHIDAGYHAMVDNTELIVAAGDDLQVQGAGGVNSRSLHICIVPGRAVWTRDTWMQHQPAMRLGAAWCADKCHLHGIPPIHLSPAQVATPGVKGICTHGDVSVYHPESEGHTDPGPNFPLDDIVIPMIGGVAPVKDEEYEDMIIEAPARFQTDPNAPKCLSLDIPNKKFNRLNGCPAPVQGDKIPTQGEIRGWYEIFTDKGAKRGFKVIGARDAAGKNPAFTFTWP